MSGNFEKNTKYVVDLIEIFEMRANIEENYCKGLDNLSNLIEKLAQKDYHDKNLSQLILGIRSSILT